MNWLAVAAGGALGSLARFALGLAFPVRGFPYVTFGINLVGSFFMGLLVGYFLARADMSSALRAGLLSGLLGGFTTFSAFSIEVVALLQEQHYARAVLYAGGSVLLGVAAAALGLWLARTG